MENSKDARRTNLQRINDFLAPYVPAMKIIFGITVGLIILIEIIVANQSPEQKAAEAEQLKREMAALPAITAADIALAYAQNSVAADQRFKGKKFKVAGSVVDINTDILGDPYITLRSGINQFMEPHFGFEKSAAAQLAKLKRGSMVTLVCIGKGDVAKIPMSDSCLLL